MHTAGDAQSSFDVQAFRQTLVPHWYGKQEMVAGVTQVPAPSQVEAPVDIVVPDGQTGSLQEVPSPYFWQAPASHLPLVPQLACPWSTQIPCVSVAPVAMLLQVPSDVCRAQLVQAPLQAVWQQTPCSQNALAHSLAAEQLAPSGFGPQEFIWQTFGVRHCASVEQTVKHFEPLQTYGRQGCPSGAAHWPLVLQVEGAV